MFAATESRANGLQDALPPSRTADITDSGEEPREGEGKTNSYLHILLKDQLDRRELSIRDLARMCGTTATVVSRWVTADPQRRVIPESKGCVQLAHALGLDVIEVLVAAGRIPPLDGRPPHPNEAEIKRLEFMLDLVLRRIPVQFFPTYYRIISTFFTVVGQAADGEVIDDVAGSESRT